MKRIRDASDFLLLIAGLLVAWQCVSLVVGGRLVVPPLETLREIGVLFHRPSFWAHVNATALAFAYASAITIVLGLLAGVWLGTNRAAFETTEPMLASIASLPKVTLYPIILTICGLGLSAKVAFGVIHGIVPITLFTMGAVRNIQPIYLRVGQMHNLSPRARFFHLLLPAAFPEIFSGIRVGLSVTLLGVVLGEMFASRLGMGSMLMGAIGLADFPAIAAVTLILILAATVLSSGLLWIDRRLHHRD